MAVHLLLMGRSKQEWESLSADAYSLASPPISSPSLLSFSPLCSQESCAAAAGGMSDSLWLYQRACSAYAALEAAMSSSGGPFFFGAAPSSLDALLYGHMAAVKTQLAARWIRKVAPGLTQHFQRMQQLYFSQLDAAGELMPQRAGAVPSTAAAAVPAADEVLSPAPLPAITVRGRPNLFQAYASAIQARTGSVGAAAGAAGAEASASSSASSTGEEGNAERKAIGAAADAQALAADAPEGSGTALDALAIGEAAWYGELSTSVHRAASLELRRKHDTTVQDLLSTGGITLAIALILKSLFSKENAAAAAAATAAAAGGK